MVFEKLGLSAVNIGTCTGQKNGWLSNGQRTIESINPATETILGSVKTASQDDYEAVISSAAKAQLSWKQRPAPKRGDVVRQIGEQLRRHKDVLGTLVAMEMGKSKAEGDGEVQEMIDMAEFAVGQSRMLYGKTMHSERPEHRLYEQWHPLGIVGVISAFNFPVAVWSWNAFIAAICGNVVVWKPSSKTPLCAIAVQHICNQVMLDNDCPGVFSCFIPEERSISDAFVQDKRVSLISFTGSTQTGLSVHQKVATRLGKSLLELGGNNAVILDEDADLTLAIPAIVFGAIGTAGQRCTSTRRLFVPKSMYTAVRNQLIAAYGQLRMGDPLVRENHMGPLIDATAVSDYEQAICAAMKQGGDILFGGQKSSQPGFFVQPTVIEIAHDCAVVQQETFAPILYLITYETFEQAIAWQNAVPQGLSSALFTNNLQRAEVFLSACGSDCGIANINVGTSGAEIGGAFGGEKETGGGREAGSDAWKAYMRRQTNTINWGSDLPLAQGIQFKLK